MMEHNKMVSRLRSLATMSLKAPYRYRAGLWRHKFEPVLHKAERYKVGLSK
jgi:hypothetical protein